VTPRRRLILVIFATLGVAAWLNAGQERRCGTCSPMAATFGAMACELKTPAR
jgi:hypothetical protein